MIRALVRRLFPMPHDVMPSRRPRHRGRPALVAVPEHTGATEEWSPWQEITSAEVARQPEETPAEAVEREAAELARHRAEVSEQVSEEVRADFSEALDGLLPPLFAAVEDACQAALAGLGISVADFDRLVAGYRSAAVPTGEYQIIRELAVA